MIWHQRAPIVATTMALCAQPLGVPHPDVADHDDHELNAAMEAHRLLTLYIHDNG